MKKKISLCLILLFSIIAGVIVWPNIIITIETSYSYGDQYFTNNYNKSNDTFRFIIFILISLLPFFLTYYTFNKSKIYSIKEFLSQNHFKTYSNKNVSIIFYLLILFSVIEFLLIDFTFLISELDLFHEGLWIQSSYNYIKTKQLWQSSYIDRGLFGNYFPLIVWNDFNTNIGPVRFLETVLLLLNKIFLLVLAKQISDNLNFDNLKKIIFFLILSILFINEVSYFTPEKFYGRSALILLFLNIFLFSLRDYKKYSFLFFILGLFSVISFIWYLDVAAYINFSLVTICLFFVAKKDPKILISIIFGILIGWILFFFLLNPDEINDFLYNTITIFQTIDQIHGLIYPVPFFSGDARATKAVLFFVLGGIFTIFVCLNKNNFNTKNKIFFLILFLLSLASFKTGLSRSDGPHIKVATGPILLILYTYILYYLLNLSKFEYYKKIILINKKIISGLVIIGLVFNFNLQNIKNIHFFKHNLIKLLNAKDEEYLIGEKKKYINLLKLYSELSKDEGCALILSDEIIIPYLLKKNSCTKFYEIWISQPEDVQKKFIKELEEKKPKIILKRKVQIFTPKLEYVENYIDKTYEVHKDYQEWIFLKLKK